MGREEPEIEIRVHPKKGDNSVHPMRPGLSNSSAPYVSMQPYRKWTPWIIPLFVIANIVVFVITMSVNNCPKNSTSCVARFLGRLSFQPLKENPLLGPSALTLQKMGGLEVNKVVEGHQRWRLLTCIWLHGGVVHILANMLSLLFIGIRLEQEFGFVRIGMIYIISGIGGAIMSGLFLKSSISVGASGALFGLLGSMLSELITNWTMYGNKFAALFSLLFIIVINLAVGILPHVDNFAHIGGFLTGFLLGFVFLLRPQFGWDSKKYAPGGYDIARVKSKHKIYQYLLWIIALTLVIVGFTVGLVMVFRGINGNDHCSWCHYLSCVPTSKWSCRSKGGVTCTKITDGNQMNMTCTSNGKTSTYYSPLTDSQLTQLCIQLCN